MSYLVFKRLFDIFFSLIFLIFNFPFFLIIGCLIKCCSKGPVFYSSPRLGLNFKPIYCVKFRSMHLDADQRLEKLLREDHEITKEWNLYQKLKKDPRIHFIGAFLRKTSLDELPQFFNVLKGDLSIIGPRPFLKEQINTLANDKAVKFLSIKPGITGLWQTSGRNLLTFAERLVLEEYYIDYFCFLMDLKIFLKTIPVILLRKGAY